MSSSTLLTVLGSGENGGDQEWYEAAINAIETDRTNTFFAEGKHAMKQALNWYV